MLLSFFLFKACQRSAAPVSISNRPVSINGVPQTNAPMPPLKNVEKLGWQTSESVPVKLGELKGKVVVLDFWATYCPPCLDEIPHLVALQERHKASGLEIVGLHVGGEEDRPKVPAFVEKLKMSYTLAYPEDALTEMLFGGNNAIPQTFVFDRKGNLVRKFVGFNDDIKNELDKIIEQAIGEKQENS